jgi:hypothetical protein
MYRSLACCTTYGWYSKFRQLQQAGVVINNHLFYTTRSPSMVEIQNIAASSAGYCTISNQELVVGGVLQDFVLDHQ